MYEGVTLERILKEHCMTSDQLDCEIEDEDVTYLARHFGNVELYPRVLKLTDAEQADVKKMVHEHGNQ